MYFKVNDIEYFQVMFYAFTQGTKMVGPHMLTDIF
jgi:hypothetical protein